MRHNARPTRAFISFHHDNDEWAKEHLAWHATYSQCFQDMSVNTGDIEDDGSRTSESIRVQIRDHYLRDSEVTVLLCGTETKGRKYIDWELKSSMINTRLNSRSGILVVALPSVYDGRWLCSMAGERAAIYPDYSGIWTSSNSRSEYRELYPFLPERIVDNLYNPRVNISIVPWERIENNPYNLKWLIDNAALYAGTNEYDMARKMRRRDTAQNPLLSHFLATGDRSFYRPL